MNIKVLDDLNITYKINNKKVKYLRVRYDEYGDLVINKPIRMSYKDVDKFINNNIDWIVSHKPTKNLSHKNYVSGDDYLLFGKKLKLELINQRHEEVIVNNDTIYVYFNDLSHVGKLLDEYRFKVAEIVFNELLYKCFNDFSKYNITYPKLEIKKSKSKWGTCFTKQNKIMLNVALVHVPYELITYVIYHELSHFVVPNHQKEFHNVLLSVCPDERKYGKYLKNYSTLYA